MNLPFFLIATTALVVRAYTRKSLTVSGILAAIITAWYFPTSALPLPVLFLSIPEMKLILTCTLSYQRTRITSKQHTLHPPHHLLYSRHRRNKGQTRRQIASHALLDR